MEGMKLAVVVPTRNRPEKLGRLMSFISAQTTTPDLLVVVDASDPEMRTEVKQVLEDFEDSLEISLITTERPSAPRQRNLGVAALEEQSGLPEIVVFLDDDVEPEPSYLAELLSVFQGDLRNQVGGVSGMSQLGDRSKAPLRRVIAKVFMFGEGRPGSVMSSGINIPVPEGSLGPVETEWLFGCSGWRRDVLREFRFTELGSGYALYDDVEFSVRVGRRWKLIVNPQAMLFHNHAEPREEKQIEVLAYQFIVNRYFVVRYCLRRANGVLAFWWSTLGVIILWTSQSFGADSKHARARLRGFIRGIKDLVSRDAALPWSC